MLKYKKDNPEMGNTDLVCSRCGKKTPLGSDFVKKECHVTLTHVVKSQLNYPFHPFFHFRLLILRVFLKSSIFRQFTAPRVTGSINTFCSMTSSISHVIYRPRNGHRCNRNPHVGRLRYI